MTIHGSKGLEAPVVFLADCNSTASNKNAYSSLVQWPAEESKPVSFQLQLSKIYTDTITLQLQQEKLKAQQLEELNLLYVAFTRAREQLYISVVASRKRQNNSWYQIIANGLSEVTQQQDGVDGLHFSIYEHLRYTQSEIDSSTNHHSNKKETKVCADNIDKRLLMPMTNITPPNFMIAPSLATGNLFKGNLKKSDNSYSDDPNNDSVYQQDLAKWRGTIIHQVIEHLCNSDTYPSAESDIQHIENKLTAKTSLTNPAFIHHIDECIQEAVNTYNHPGFESLFNTEGSYQTFNEMPLMYTYEKKSVYGIIDRVIKEEKNKTVTVIDYKSHRLITGESAEDTALQFSKQLEYYRVGIDKLWPQQTIKTGILFTHSNEIVWFDK